MNDDFKQIQKLGRARSGKPTNKPVLWVGEIDRPPVTWATTILSLAVFTGNEFRWADSGSPEDFLILKKLFDIKEAPKNDQEI